jgi:alkanesulfonate monooxygenase SsuD/methylene tetrahydromethanopterin reductase-like flavin-dependent oxidoreductase (luciferase family)
VRTGLNFTLDKPLAGQDVGRLYGFVLELCEEAEHLGADSVWFSEHHLWGSHLTQPLVYCAAAAARTRRIRVGSGVVIASYRSAAHLAEEAIVVDLVSGGRLNLGMGAGYRIAEFDLFGADVSRRYDLIDERAREVHRLLADDALSPLPVQQPLPLWLGYQGPRGARRAGRLGLGLLSADGTLWKHYRDGLEQGGHGAAVGRMTGSVSAWVCDDPETGWARVGAGVLAKFDAYREIFVEGRDLPKPRPVDGNRLLNAEMSHESHLGYFLCGTPDDVALRIKSYVADAPVEEIYIDAPVGGLPEELVVEHVQMICGQLRPLLALDGQ